MNVSIAGVVVEVAGCPEALASMYREYLVGPCEPEIRLGVGSGPEGWMLHEREDMKLWIAPDRRQGRVIPRMGDGAVDRALRMMMAEALPRRGGVGAAARCGGALFRGGSRVRRGERGREEHGCEAAW